ncbi:hypothetical protein [Fibrobacter sp. UWP2]|uniref:hypothetical protein n=1 Tax=Fibrobacter sp. UWP2 TaxID=1896216 RepID=UPI0011604317|nr:hypothetical protein [Fibrobacter sp. UWP2]
MKRLSILKVLMVALAFCLGSSFAQAPADATSAAAAPADPAAGSMSFLTPFFLGGALGFGSGTGVGTERGLGLRQIEPMVGLWYPGLGFLRVGYGFFDFEEDAEKGEDYKVEHSDFDVEVGLHLLGLFYVVGNYSRARDLSDMGDVSWNEWGVGFGSIINIFAKTMLFADVSYRWVLEHYDPFLDKDVSGSRIQLNLGFAAMIF